MSIPGPHNSKMPNRKYYIAILLYCRYVNEMNGVLGHDSALRVYWAGDNLGE